MFVRIFVLSILFSVSSFSLSQDLSVSDEILEELETVQVDTESSVYTFRVHYPENYDDNKEYSCFLGLSGGGQSMKIVNFCYASWFRSGYFKDYLTILPVVDHDVDTVNFKDYSPERIEELLNAVRENFPVTDKMLIGGTSNGGIAAFNFVAAFPHWFEGIITAPGIITENIEPNQNWSHLRVVMAYGDQDTKLWIKEVKSSAKRIKKIVSSVQVIPLKNQGHILPVEFNVDKMYDPYFLN